MKVSTANLMNVIQFVVLISFSIFMFSAWVWGTFINPWYNQIPVTKEVRIPSEDLKKLQDIKIPEKDLMELEKVSILLSKNLEVLNQINTSIQAHSNNVQNIKKLAQDLMDKTNTIIKAVKKAEAEAVLNEQ